MRLAIISDIHEDLPSLDRVLKKADTQGYDQMVCLGDICGFSHNHYRYRNVRSASACLEQVRQKCDIIIPGNHDLHASSRIPVNSDIFEFPPRWYGMDSDERLELGGDRIWTHADDLCPGYSHEDLDFLRTLPEYQVLETEHMNIMLSHYAFPNLSGFGKKFYSWEAEFRPHLQFMENHNCRLSFIGHAHPIGFFQAGPDRFSQPRKRHVHIDGEQAIIGVPPVTRNRRRRGFCIFDTISSKLMLWRF